MTDRLRRFVARLLKQLGYPGHGHYDPYRGWPKCCGRYMMMSSGSLRVISDRAYGESCGFSHLRCLNCDRKENEEEWKTPGFPD